MNNEKALEALNNLNELVELYKSEHTGMAYGDPWGNFVLEESIAALRSYITTPFDEAIKIVEDMRAEFMRDVYPEYASLVCHYDAIISALKARLPK